MKLKIRYDDRFQTLELDEEATRQLWISLDLEDGGELTSKERENRLQKAFDEQFNRPEYNSWHKFDRHRGESKAKPEDDEDENASDCSEPLMDEVADDRIFYQDEIARDERDSDEAIRSWVRSVLKGKPQWAEAFIAIRMNGMQTKEYAASLGVVPSTVTHWLTRADKMIRENYRNRQF